MYSKTINISNVISNNYSQAVKKENTVSKSFGQNSNSAPRKINSENYRAYAPILFKGNAPKITNAFIITGQGENIPLMATRTNESYLIDFDSQTEIIYGVDAIRYLDNKSEFKYDTQIIFPKKSSGVLHIDSKNIELAENSSVLINAGTKADVELQQGYPMVIISKKDYDWYERYSRDSKNENIKSKFVELTKYNAHSYNGEFSLNSLLPDKMRDEKFLNSLSINKWASGNGLLDDIYSKKGLLSDEEAATIEFIKNAVDKLEENRMLEHKDNGYVHLAKPYAKDYLINDMKDKGFTQEEINLLVPVFMQAREVKGAGKFAIKNPAADYPKELILKMKTAGILHNNQKDSETNIYWKECYSSEESLREKLTKLNFSEDEQNLIIQNWENANSIGFDLSGLKFINENVAVYNLNDKINNWTNEKTNWVSNSTAIASSDGKTPFVGVSMVQTDEHKPIKMSEIRKEEVLHAHPNLDEKRQTEMYLVTSGAAALNIVKDGKTTVQILKEGELAVVGPGVVHCVNSISGEYEHIVAQLPSAFQYGFSFKTTVVPPADYDKEKLEEQAIQELSKLN